MKNLFIAVGTGQIKNQNLLWPLVVVFLAALLRLLPHPANVAPIGGMALFGGVYLPKRYAFVIPLLVMFVSDIFLGFNSSTPYVYASFLLISGIGLYLKKRKTVSSVVLASLLSSLLFYLITNFGFWLANDIYPKTFAGQLEAYILGLPFFRNTMMGDLFYTGLFFGGYELAVRIVKKLRGIFNFPVQINQ